MASPKTVSSTLLGWYEYHARELPWRISPQKTILGVFQDPYRVWLSEIMLQQTRVQTVIPYFEEFTCKWPDLKSLAASEIDDVITAWAGLGYYSRARNLHKCAKKIVDEFGAIFPQTDKELQSLPGIGEYTSAAIRAIAFNQKATVVDGNIERVMARLFAISLPKSKIKKRVYQHTKKLTPSYRPGDFVQALMDLGATICKPKIPLCDLCPLQMQCLASQKELQYDLPKPSAKTKIPTREGVLYIVMDQNDAFILERRPEFGLLAGTLGWPGYNWDKRTVEIDFSDQNFEDVPGQIQHVFSHFCAKISIKTGRIFRDDRLNPNYVFIPKEDFDPQSIPVLMRKAFFHANQNKGQKMEW